MGLNNVNTNNYYNNHQSSTVDYGEYRFVNLDNIISAFMVAYVGEGKIIPKVNRTDIQFHAMRAVQELSYDVLRSIKSHEIWVPPSLKMPLPSDYVNYMKIVRVDSNGIERILYPTSKSSNPFPVRQYRYTDGSFDFNQGITSVAANHGKYVTVGNDKTGEDGLYEVYGSLGVTNLDVNIVDDNDTYPFASTALGNFTNNNTASSAYSDDTTDLEIDNRGRRYGLDPQFAQSNGTFILDDRTGFIHFSSSLAGETIILKYISDGLGTDEEMIVHKFCEEAVYKWIAYGVLSTRSNMPEHVVQRFKKEKFAETRKAKIRLSNIKMEEFTQVLKGMSKPIK
tara:strand:- start:19615 stop:20631 length:1017 start_codon:yes stop_codon:yes gene_type:complete